MRVRVWASPWLHRLGDDYPELDDRLAMTACGILFAWTGHWPGAKEALADCPECTGRG